MSTINSSDSKLYTVIFTTVIIATTAQWFRYEFGPSVTFALSLISWLFLVTFFLAGYFTLRFGSGITVENIAIHPAAETSNTYIQNAAAKTEPFRHKGIRNAGFIVFITIAILMFVPLIKNQSYLGMIVMILALAMAWTGLTRALNVYAAVINAHKNGDDDDTNTGN